MITQVEPDIRVTRVVALIDTLCDGRIRGVFCMSFPFLTLYN